MHPLFSNFTKISLQVADPASVLPQEDKAQGSVSLKTYCLYFIAGGGYALLLFLLVMFLLAEVRIYV